MKAPLKITITIDTNQEGWSEELGNFAKMLIANGYGDQVKQLAGEMAAAAKRRNLPAIAELGL